MLLKCVFLLFILSVSGDFRSRPERPDSYSRWERPDYNRRCPPVKVKNGRVRYRMRGNVVRFSCLRGYTLVGDKYSTCLNRKWEDPPPVCIKSGCKIPGIENGYQAQMHSDAWLVSFCHPGYTMQGEAKLFCDGEKWNGTMPTCVEAKAPPPLSCDFELPSLCGWTDDELHDFDWKRLNRLTPSSFLNTGPQYDHTLGKGKNGYYMYIESTAKTMNATARLLSPVYEADVSKQACFSFYYHMYGRISIMDTITPESLAADQNNILYIRVYDSMGGLRIYQKPENISLQTFLDLKPLKESHLLFEKWGNQGDTWYNGVANLRELNDNFQIIIEGIRGTSFTSDLAIDDVAILYGDSCHVPTTTTPPPIYTCAGRCYTGISSVDHPPVLETYSHPNKTLEKCSCNIVCVIHSNCCPDFLEICLEYDKSTDGDGISESDDDMTSNQEMPQTEKLIGVSTTAVVVNPTTSPKTTTPKKTITTSKLTPTTSKPTAKIAIKTTTTPKLQTTTKIITTTKSFKTTTKIPTIVFKQTTPIFNATGVIKKDTKTTTTTTTTTTTKKPMIAIAVTNRYDRMKLEKERQIEKDGSKPLHAEIKQPGNGVRISLIVLSVLLCVGGAFAAFKLRRSVGLMQRLRGNVTSDPEVRYLNSHEDE